MTVPIPQNYFNAAANQGVVEIIEYDSKDYTGSMIPTRKPAYVYLPYGYDSSKKIQHHISYARLDWSGRAILRYSKLATNEEPF